MKKLVVLLLLFPFISRSLAQTKAPVEKLVLKGKFEHSPENLLYIAFRDEHNAMLLDSIQLEADGSFYYETDKCRFPQKVSMQRRRTQLNAFYVAPGFQLNIHCDATDYKTLNATLRIEGKGAAVNQYRVERTRYQLMNPADTPWFQIRSKAAFLRYTANERKSGDSIANRLLNGPAKKEPYAAAFREMIDWDHQFTDLYYLLSFANDNKMTAAETRQFIIENYKGALAADFVNTAGKPLVHHGNDGYLLSNEFRDWALDLYTDYLLKTDYEKDSTLRKNPAYRIEKISTTFKGKTRDFAMYRLINGSITYTKSIEKLNAYKERYSPYLTTFADPYYKTSLGEQIASRENELIQTGTGQPAPGFSLSSDQGERHLLSDFAGKVVYIDLWASWCSPCRAETPFLSSLYTKYKNDPRIAFISIAVSDAESAWREALKKDKPEWLQLWDKDNVVSRSYVANMIPQFVLIDKQGKIVRFDAPRPSQATELEELLLKEMGR